MGGKASRDKGKRGERRVASLYRAAMPTEAVKRGWQSRSGSDDPDVVVPMFAVEVKEQTQANVRAALAQAVAGCPEGKTPVAHIHDTGKPAFVVLRESDWMDFVREWHAAVSR